MTHDDYLSDPVWADLFARPEQARDILKATGPVRFDAADHARSLVSRQAIDEWLVYGNLRYPQISLSYGGEAAPPTLYTKSRLVGEHQITGCADARRILAQMETGATLVLVNVEHWHAPLARLRDRLRDATAADVQTFTYLTAPNQYGSRPHRDTAHVFVVQLEGSKRWTLYDLPPDGNWRRTILPDNTPFSDQLTLEAGEGLYVPPGLGHRAQAGPEGSLHLTISVQPPSVGDVAAAWAALVSKQIPAQDRLEIGAAHRAAEVREILNRLGVTLPEEAAAEVAEVAAERQRNGRL
jgi:ribosomal protein L16 Arg81 hydroxylase